MFEVQFLGWTLLTEVPMKITIDYTNYKGVRGVRAIDPILLRWGSTQYHKKPQWLLEALDCNKGEYRTFAVEDIHSVSKAD